MPVEISVGPPTLTINQGSTFMVTDLNGEITTESEQGVFAGDTRFVSHWSISANDRPWVVTIFGRDSLIVSLQSMWVHTGLALGALAHAVGDPGSRGRGHGRAEALAALGAGREAGLRPAWTFSDAFAQPSVRQRSTITVRSSGSGSPPAARATSRSTISSALAAPSSRSASTDGESARSGRASTSPSL